MCYAEKYVEPYKQTKILRKLKKKISPLAFLFQSEILNKRTFEKKKILILDSFELRLGIKSLSRYLQS